MSQLPVLIPASLLLFALLAVVAGGRDGRWAHRISLVGAVVAHLVSLVGIATVAGGGTTLRYALAGWAPPVGIEFVLDPLAAYMTGVVTFIGVVVLVYAPRSLAVEMPGKERLAFPAMVLLLAGLTGMCVTGDIFNLYVFLEIAALAAYALLASGDRGAPVATFRYLIIGSLGGGFYLVGATLLYLTAGTLNMADLHARLPELVENRAVISAALFMTVGLGVKMALFPMHFWLPDVYTNAPSAAAGLVAPVMTKVSAYVLIRLYLDVFPPGFVTAQLPLASAVGWLSALGIVYGSVLAVAQQDYRRMLAYSSVGQMGYIGLGIGLANPVGLVGGLLHILNHALMKGCLFLIGGVVRHRCGITRIPDMRGLGRVMPWTMAAFVVAALAMIGIPPTAGFFSKWYLLLGTLEAGNWWWFAAIIASSLLSAVYFFRTVEMIFRHPEDGDWAATAEPGDPPASLLVPVLILGAAIVLAGVLNVVVVNALLAPAAASLGG
ncbi:MAG TPA: proton-conducting transporter membrane subunit [Longimicrobiales bacterium]|nr:proton-conducting transporter membrane subunit [Longimicrobiales bacterium]